MTEAWEQSIRRVAIASDHAGYALKEFVKKILRSKGIEAVDLGADSEASVDYPDYAEKLATLVSLGKLKEGILVCGTGIGMSITANKFPGVRAAVVTNTFMAKACRQHNDANVLCLGSRVVSEAEAQAIVETWLAEPFEGGRHDKRLQKLRDLDRNIVPPTEPETKIEEAE